MTFDSLIAVVALAIAAYQIMPRERQLELRFRFRLPELLVVLAAFLLILYLQFYPSASALGLTPRLGLSRYGLTPHNVSFLTLLAAVGVTVWRHSRYRLKARHVGRFSRLVEELHQPAAISALATLVKRHLLSLRRIAARRTGLDRIRDWIAPPTRVLSLIAQFSQSRNPVAPHDRLARRTLALRRLLAKVLPHHEVESALATRTLATLLSSELLAREMAATDPYAALRLLEIPLPEVHSFFDRYIRALLENTGSVLYREMDQVRCWHSGVDIGIDAEETPLLGFLFGDAKQAEALYAWKPAGDRMLEELSPLRGLPSSDPYNRVASHGDEEMKRSLLFRGLDYFDLMVTRALRQGVTWHMWLYYLPLIVDEVLERYRASGTGERTYYDRLLEHIVLLLRDWCHAVEEVPIDQENVKLRDTHANHENGNIIKSSMLALGQTMRSLGANKEVPAAFRNSLGRLAMGLALDLRANPELEGYSAALLNALIAGGSRTDRSKEHLRWLLEIFESLDKVQYKRENRNWMKSELSRALEA